MPTIASSHKALTTYYETLADLHAQAISNEGGLRRAFATLLATLGRAEGWTLAEEQTLPGRIRPDGVLLDELRFPRAYWEAKDTHDDLEVEIRKKFQLGYPQTNIVFEDGRTAILFQNRRRVAEADMRDRTQLALLLAQLFSHTEQQIEAFQQAVAEFKTRIPELATSVEQTIEEERAKNQRFITAFEAFHQICRQAIDPNISADSIEKMLVQHLLTERLFRTVFDDPDFTRRNAIANEIELVIRSLTWNRSAFLKRLDPFYLAIEEAARTIDDYAQKQTFLNTVYERFFQGYSRDQADTHGVVYTPQPIVDFMVASVEQVLQREFGKRLSDPGVCILDPATGTGNFIVNILRQIGATSRRDLKRKYQQELFANEIMLLPYYIASLNIEHAYYELTGEYAPFEGICFTDTLDLAESPQLSLFAEENTARVERQKSAAITVIIGNPPYNVGQANENDNNKNRRYEGRDGVDQRVRETYVKDSKATNRNKLSDPYVKFFRWAADRLRGQDGIVCYISNNSFVDQFAFDGMRKHLLSDFDQIYHLDLHGNVRKNPKLSGTTHNVFGIQVGVGITIAIRNSKTSERFIRYYRVPEIWTKIEKLAFLAEAQSMSGIAWQELQPDSKNTWLTEGIQDEYDGFLSLGTKESKAGRYTETQTLFKMYSLGVVTNRDDWVYDFNRITLADRISRFIETYNSEIDRWKRLGEPTDIDNFVLDDEQKIKWSRDLKSDLRRGRYATFNPSRMRRSLYRPFTVRHYFFDLVLSQDIFLQPHFFPTLTSEEENLLICVPGPGNRKIFGCLVTNMIPALDLAFEKAQCFPFYVYDEDGRNRRENITDWALTEFQVAYGAHVTKRDIFHYVYALLHHPAYRERYAENLKRELPRVPLVGFEQFGAFVEAGRRLAALHLGYEQAAEHPLQWVENHAVPFSWRVERMRLSADKSTLAVNPSLTLAGIPPECLRYRLGNRSALEWVIDQYQVSTDKRSGIVSDPNRADDEEYIVRLVGRVITVSLETMQIVDGLPPMP